MLTIEPADSSVFERLVSIWETSVRETHFFLTESDITELRPLLLNTYLPNLPVFITRDATGTIHGFIGVDENRIEMLFVDAASRGKVSESNFLLMPLRNYTQMKWMLMSKTLKASLFINTWDLCKQAAQQ